MIRDACEADLETLFELYTLFISKMKGLRSTRYALHDDEKEHFLNKTRSRISKDDSCVIVYEKHKEVVGFVIGSIEENPSFCKERNIGDAHLMVIREDFQNAGIGSELLEAVISFFKEKGIRQVEGTVDLKNEQSMAFMKKNGFSEEIAVVVRDI